VLVLVLVLVLVQVQVLVLVHPVPLLPLLTVRSACSLSLFLCMRRHPQACALCVVFRRW
jgi:hypothetical protein